MQRYWNYTRASATATPAPGALIEVFLAGTTTLATLYADRLDPPTPKGNPFPADADGFFYFYAAAGRYDVRISGAGVTNPYTWADVLLLDAHTVAYTDRANTFNGVQTIAGEIVGHAGAKFGPPPGVALITSEGKLAGLTSAYLASLDGSLLTGLNASQLLSGTVPSARLAGSYTGAITLSNAANVLAGASLALGATPAQTGALRLTFNEAVTARNQANSSDVALLRLSTDDYLVLASASAQHLRPLVDDLYSLGTSDLRWRNGHIKDLYVTGFLGLGVSADQATAGLVRLPNGTAGAITWRDAAGSANLGSIYATVDDALYLAFATTVVNDLEPDSDNDEWIGATDARFAGVRVGTALVVGTNPAATGAVRLANAGKIVARDAANANDVDLLALDAADWLRVSRRLRYDGPQGTGSDTPVMGTNAPALNGTSPYTWFTMMTADGVQVAVPAWRLA